GRKRRTVLAARPGAGQMPLAGERYGRQWDSRFRVLRQCRHRRPVLLHRPRPHGVPGIGAAARLESIFRKSGCRFSEENATKSIMLEPFPNQYDRETALAAAVLFHVEI